MKECVRKLALWYTRYFKPIITHDELEPIMATLGFVGLPPTSTTATSIAWKEYIYTAESFWCKSVSESDPPPKPRLPYPRIDGLHIYTYRAFVDALCFYLDMSDISDIFHIRCALALCFVFLFLFFVSWITNFYEIWFFYFIFKIYFWLVL